jgi:hypothetical protein
MFVQMNDVPIPNATTISLYFFKNQELNYLRSFAILLKNATSCYVIAWFRFWLFLMS